MVKFLSRFLFPHRSDSRGGSACRSLGEDGSGLDLESEVKIMENNKIKTRFVITLWVNNYDYDGLWCDFELFDQNCYTLENSQKVVEIKIGQILKKELTGSQNHWKIMELEDYKLRPTFGDINQNNEIVYDKQLKIGDGTGYNTKYYYFDVLEIGVEEILGPEQFMNENCEYEVKSYFANKNK